MRKKIRKYCFQLCNRRFVFVCLFLCVLMGCSAEMETSKTESVKIGVTVYDQYDTFVSALMDEFHRCASRKEKDTGIDIHIDVYNASDSQSTQNEQVEEMIKDGCDVICVNLVDRTEPTTIIDMAEKNDVPVIFFNRELVEEDLERWDKVYYVGAKAFESGIMQGEIAADIFKSDAKADKNGDGVFQYVVLEGEAGHQDAIVRSIYHCKSWRKGREAWLCNCELEPCTGTDQDVTHAG